MFERIYGKDGEHRTPYMTRVSLTPMTRWGQLRLHVFHRGDADPDPHDHAADFWTLPLTPYMEEVHRPDSKVVQEDNVVEAWRVHFRPATYTHRVVGRLGRTGVGGADYVLLPRGSASIVTLVWRRPTSRDWGFWVDGAFVPWRRYVFGGRDDVLSAIVVANEPAS